MCVVKKSFLNRLRQSLIAMTIGVFSLNTIAAQSASQSDNASAMSAEEVNALVKKAEQVAYYSGHDGKSMARMLIVDEQGRKQMRQFTILRKDVEDSDGVDTGDQRMLVFFSRPTEVQGTVFRVEKHACRRLSSREPHFDQCSSAFAMPALSRWPRPIHVDVETSTHIFTKVPIFWW